jgi:hypothetical protein
MTASELTRFQLEQTEMQLKACIEPMNDAQLDTRVTPQGMTPRETVEHLCECCEAFLAAEAGQKWSWGTYNLDDKSKEGLSSTFGALRAKVSAAAASSQDDEILKEAFSFLTAHDAYHVGQLALVHMATNPDWDPYSIYKG